MSNRRRRPRHAQPINQQRRHHRHPPSDRPPALYSIGFYDPDGDEIEVTIDLNDPAADPILVELIRLMTDNCPLCNDHHQEDNRHGRE